MSKEYMVVATLKGSLEETIGSGFKEKLDAERFKNSFTGKMELLEEYMPDTDWRLVTGLSVEEFTNG